MAEEQWKEAIGNFWKPEKEEDFIEGLLIEVEKNVGENSSVLYTIQQKNDGENVNVWGSAILDSRMKGILCGEEVKIIYKGLGEAKKGKHAPKLWKVLHRGPGTPD